MSQLKMWNQKHPVEVSQVMGVPAGQAKVEVFVWPNNSKKNSSISKEEIQKRLEEDYKLTISVANNKLTTIAEPKHRDTRLEKCIVHFLQNICTC
jgi:hypothetical protein